MTAAPAKSAAITTGPTQDGSDDASSAGEALASAGSVVVTPSSGSAEAVAAVGVLGFGFLLGLAVLVGDPVADGVGVGLDAGALVGAGVADALVGLAVGCCDGEGFWVGVGFCVGLGVWLGAGSACALGAAPGLSCPLPRFQENAT